MDEGSSAGSDLLFYNITTKTTKTTTTTTAPTTTPGAGDKEEVGTG